jgi:hypothetical protein
MPFRTLPHPPLFITYNSPIILVEADTMAMSIMEAGPTWHICLHGSSNLGNRVHIIFEIKNGIVEFLCFCKCFIVRH